MPVHQRMGLEQPTRAGQGLRVGLGEERRRRCGDSERKSDYQEADHS